MTKFFSFLPIVFGSFLAVIKEIFDDVEFKKTGVGLVRPPPEYFNSKPFNPCWEKTITVEEVYIQRMTPLNQQKSNGLYHHDMEIGGDPKTVAEFLNMEFTETSYLKKIESIDQFEEAFWKKPHMRTQIYGFSFNEKNKLFKRNCSIWNIDQLNDLLQNIRNLYGLMSKGVNKSSLIFGQIGSTFCIHTEDWNLPAINYLLHGSPKIWYVIAPADHHRFRELIMKEFQKSSTSDEFRAECANHLGHKTAICSPNWLRKNGIPYTRVVQEPGHFVVVAPGAYHFGYNMGPNVSEAINFLTTDIVDVWKIFGRQWKFCSCNLKNSTKVELGLEELLNMNQANIMKRYE